MTLRRDLAAQGVGRIAHGEDSETARPKGFALVIWIGSVKPNNATDGDLWIDTS